MLQQIYLSMSTLSWFIMSSYTIVTGWTVNSDLLYTSLLVILKCEHILTLQPYFQC